MRRICSAISCVIICASIASSDAGPAASSLDALGFVASDAESDSSLVRIPNEMVGYRRVKGKKITVHHPYIDTAVAKGKSLVISWTASKLVLFVQVRLVKHGQQTISRIIKAKMSNPRRTGKRQLKWKVPCDVSPGNYWISVVEVTETGGEFDGRVEGAGPKSGSFRINRAPFGTCGQSSTSDYFDAYLNGASDDSRTVDAAPTDMASVFQRLATLSSQAQTRTVRKMCRQLEQLQTISYKSNELRHILAKCAQLRAADNAGSVLGKTSKTTAKAMADAKLNPTSDSATAHWAWQKVLTTVLAMAAAYLALQLSKTKAALAAVLAQTRGQADVAEEHKRNRDKIARLHAPGQADTTGTQDRNHDQIMLLKTNLASKTEELGALKESTAELTQQLAAAEASVAAANERIAELSNVETFSLAASFDRALQRANELVAEPSLSILLYHCESAVKRLQSHPAAECRMNGSTPAFRHRFGVSPAAGPLRGGTRQSSDLSQYGLDLLGAIGYQQQSDGYWVLDQVVLDEIIASGFLAAAQRKLQYAYAKSSTKLLSAVGLQIWHPHADDNSGRGATQWEDIEERTARNILAKVMDKCRADESPVECLERLSTSTTGVTRLFFRDAKNVAHILECGWASPEAIGRSVDEFISNDRRLRIAGLMMPGLKSLMMPGLKSRVQSMMCEGGKPLHLILENRITFHRRSATFFGTKGQPMQPVILQCGETWGLAQAGNGDRDTKIALDYRKEWAEAIAKPFPVNWTVGSAAPMPLLQRLEKHSHEFQRAAALLRSSIEPQKQVCVVAVHGVCHSARTAHYNMAKRELKRLRGSHGEVDAFHGTALQAVQPICCYGFVVRERNASQFGTGVYFSPAGHGRRAEMMAIQKQYSSPDGRGIQHLLLCKVLSGVTEQVRDGGKRGNPQFQPSSPAYDSGTDQELIESSHRLIVWAAFLATRVLPYAIVSVKVGSGAKDGEDSEEDDDSSGRRLGGGDPSTCAFEFFSEQKTWVKYSDDANATVAEALARGKQQANFKHGQYTYTLDLRRMRQKNDQTGVTRLVRRVGAKPWQSSGGK